MLPTKAKTTTTIQHNNHKKKLNIRTRQHHYYQLLTSSSKQQSMSSAQLVPAATACKSSAKQLKSRAFLLSALASSSLFATGVNILVLLAAICFFAAPLHLSAYAHSLSAHESSSSSNAIYGQSNGHYATAAARMSNSLPGSSGGQQNRCMSGWMWFNNKCWVSTSSRRDWPHAVELCKKMYFESTLPTIHSEEENEFLRNNIDLRNSPIWLYGRHNHQYNQTRWLDKSHVNYTRWDSGQPSDKTSMVCIKTEDNWYMRKTEPINGNTECVSFWEDAKWSTSVGCTVLLPVVCEKKLAPSVKNFDGNSTVPIFGEVTSALAAANTLRNELSTFVLSVMALIAMYQTRQVQCRRY